MNVISFVVSLLWISLNVFSSLSMANAHFFRNVDFCFSRISFSAIYFYCFFICSSSSFWIFGVSTFGLFYIVSILSYIIAKFFYKFSSSFFSSLYYFFFSFSYFSSSCLLSSSASFCIISDVCRHWSTVEKHPNLNFSRHVLESP